MQAYQNIELSRDKKEHLYLQLFRALEKRIMSGRLRPHQKLPPIRKLADLLQVNNVTVVNAYKLLEENGLVYKKVGSGTFVTPVEEDQVASEARGAYEIDYLFSSSTPSADLFPVDVFKRAINEVLDRDLGTAFGYQDAQGYLPLRESIVTYLNDNEVSVGPDEVQIISGAQQGIDLVSKAILHYGDYVLVESPTYTGAIAAFKMKGANIIEVPMGPDGIDVEALEAAVKRYKPKLFFTMPTLHNPTGCSYTTERKRQVLRLAKDYRFWVLEDDYASDLFFGSENGETLKSLDDDQRVIYIKSFSKIFMPGLRLGFMVAPNRLGQELLMAKHITDIATSGLTQRAFDLFLRKGDWKKQIDSMKRIFHSRYQVAVAALESHLPMECDFRKPSGGLNFWIQLPGWVDADKFHEFALENGIEVVSGNAFFSTPSKISAFRLSVAAIYEEDIEPGIKRLCHLLNLFMDQARKEKKQEGKQMQRYL